MPNTARKACRKTADAAIIEPPTVGFILEIAIFSVGIGFLLAARNSAFPAKRPTFRAKTAPPIRETVDSPAF